MKVIVELDHSAELSIRTAGYRADDPAQVLPLLATAVKSAIQRHRSGQTGAVVEPPSEDLNDVLLRQVLDLSRRLEDAERQSAARALEVDAETGRADMVAAARDQLQARVRELEQQLVAEAAAGAAREQVLQARMDALRASQPEKPAAGTPRAPTPRGEKPVTVRASKRARRAPVAPVAAVQPVAPPVPAARPGQLPAAPDEAVAAFDARRREVLRLLDEGMSPEEAVDQVGGVSLAQVRRWDREAG